MLGFLYFSSVPGIFLLYVLNLNRLETFKRLALPIGLSISFLVFVGLGMNAPLPAIGVARPLSTLTLVGGYSATLTALTLIAYAQNTSSFGADLSNSLSSRRRLWNELMPFGIMALTLPLLMFIAISIENGFHTSIPIYFVLVLASAYVLAVWRSSAQISTSTYVVAIWMFSLSFVLASPCAA